MRPSRSTATWPLSVLAWTTTKPAEAGVYLRNHPMGAHLSLCHIVETDEGRLESLRVDGGTRAVDDLDPAFRYCGPLPPLPAREYDPWRPTNGTPPQEELDP